MAKDPIKNRYFQLGIAWNSWTLAKLEADAKLHQMEDQITKLMVLRLTEYYKLVEKGMIIPGATAMMPAPMQVQTSSNGHTPDVAGKRESAAEQEQPGLNTVGESSNAGENADEALDFYKMDDEEGTDE